MGGATSAAKDTAKSIVKSPKAVAGGLAAPFTGGASLALTAKEGYEGMKSEKEEASQKRAQRRAVLEAERAEKEREKKKMEELAGRNESRASGISSLIGGGSTLG